MTGTNDLALPKGDVSEVVARRAALVTFEGVQIPVVHKAQLLQASDTNTSALVEA